MLTPYVKKRKELKKAIKNCQVIKSSNNFLTMVNATKEERMEASIYQNVGV